MPVEFVAAWNAQPGIPLDGHVVIRPFSAYAASCEKCLRGISTSFAFWTPVQGPREVRAASVLLAFDRVGMCHVAMRGVVEMGAVETVSIGRVLVERVERRNEEMGPNRVFVRYLVVNVIYGCQDWHWSARWP